MSSPLRASNEGLLRPRVARAQGVHRAIPSPAGGIFSIQLGTSVGTCNGLLKHRAEAKVGNGIFEVGIEPLEGSHVRVGDVFHREGDSFFALAKWSHRMPELISIEDDEIAWLGDQLKMLGLFHRIVFEQLANQFALRRLVNEPHQNGIASTFVVGRVVVKSDMVPRLCIVVERAGMGVVLRTEAELGPHQSAQEIDEGLGSVQIEKARGLLDHRVVTYTPALFVAGNVVAIQQALHPLRLRNEMLFHHRPREKLRNKQELVLVPIFTRDQIEIQLFDCLIDRVNEGTDQ